MNKCKTVFGARAKVVIDYEGDLRELARYLGERLFQIEFYFDTDMDPPHDEFAMSEALGFSVWLYHLSENENFNFEFSFETNHALEEVMDDRMYDLSPWLLRFVRDIGRLKAEIC